jgi:hypothetical protein
MTPPAPDGNSGAFYLPVAPLQRAPPLTFYTKVKALPNVHYYLFKNKQRLDALLAATAHLIGQYLDAS